MRDAPIFPMAVATVRASLLPAPLRRPLAASCAVVVALCIAGCRTGASPVDAGPEDDAAIVLDLRQHGPDASLPVAYSTNPIAPILTTTEWPPKNPDKASDERKAAGRLGYLRKGAQIRYVRALQKGNCKENWYELDTGGFVCGKYLTLDAADPELTAAASPPDATQPLPYSYGLNLTHGAPIYRRRPLKKERKEIEKGLQVGKNKNEAERSQVKDKDGQTPWYLRDHKGQRPLVTFDELRGSGLLVMRMLRGFYLALDPKEVSTQSGRFYKTTEGYLVPRDHVLLHTPKDEFHGADLRDGKLKLPLGFVTSHKAWKYKLSDDGREVHRNERAERFAIVQLTGKSATVEGRGYFETSEGWWLKDYDGSITRPGPPPKALKAGEKWVDVNLSTQTVVAFEGDKPVFATAVSTGRKDKDPSKDHRTVTGEFRIREKHISSTMDDDGTSEGPYSIQDVPWVMYFEKSFALHGAFWHSRWGHEKSHGCVNMAPPDARWIFHWVGPSLPQGWHGVRGTDANPGTWVLVHEDPGESRPADESDDDAKQ